MCIHTFSSKPAVKAPAKAGDETQKYQVDDRSDRHLRFYATCSEADWL